ncbi:unnamed protein product [Cunninghamella blakesleeana]
MFALLRLDDSRDALLTRCINELSVFLEEKTKDIVERAFDAIDKKSYMPTDSEQQINKGDNNNNNNNNNNSNNISSEPSSIHINETNTLNNTIEISATNNDREDDEDDEDDDTNFKRRNVNKTTSLSEITSSSTTTYKRPLSPDDNNDNTNDHHSKKHIRTDAPEQTNERPSIIGRLGPRRPRNRCFDYDEKGYCVRGDFCPYEHGDDRIVMESNGEGNIATLSDQQKELNNQHHHSYQGHRGGGPMRTRGRGGGRGGSGMGGNRNHREQLPYTSRYTSYSTKIVVENIPTEHCNIDAVTTYFGKFGKLTNLSVLPDQSRAFLQYSSHQEALAAYQSPAVIFNNRFVKVYWEKVDEEEEKREYMEQLRLASQPDPELVKAKAAQLAKEKEEKQKKHQEHLKKILDVQKQKQQLIERQIDEQKKLMQKLQSTPPGSKEREEILTAMSDLSTLIKANQTSIGSSTTPSFSSSSLSSSSQQPTSPITATEKTEKEEQEPSSSEQTHISSLSKEQENKSLTIDEKKAEMERLKAKLASLEAAKLSSQRGGFRGRGGMYTWSARGARSYNLDNRKKPNLEPSENESDKNKEENNKTDTSSLSPTSLETTTDTKVDNVDN